jgi:hypothetical protein
VVIAMPDLPDPRSPLNKMEQLVYGVNAVRHPITGLPLQMGGYGSSHPASSPNVQAREHLNIIEREHGIEVAKQVKAKLEAWEAAGNTVGMPAPDVPKGFERALRKG